jgi:hypothetical protein
MKMALKMTNARLVAARVTDMLSEAQLLNLRGIIEHDPAFLLKCLNASIDHRLGIPAEWEQKTNPQLSTYQTAAERAADLIECDRCGVPEFPSCPVANLSKCDCPCHKFRRQISELASAARWGEPELDPRKSASPQFSRPAPPPAPPDQGLDPGVWWPSNRDMDLWIGVALGAIVGFIIAMVIK